MKRLGVLLAFVVIASIAAVAPPGMTTQAQTGCFQETGFCVTNPAFAEYFRVRGGTRILGYPISREFTLEGFQVQFFQRVILQIQSGQIARLNVLDPNIMPMTRANQSVFPGPDPALAAQAPQTTSPTYANDVIQFVQRVSPNVWNGLPVGFFDLFNTTVPVDVAFPGQTPNPELVTLLNLEIWGLPTSNPAADPGNGGFVYQRYQRGIMHFDTSCGCTQGILVGEYFKSVITGKNLPPDLNQDMQGSRYLGQYSPGSPGWVARPAQLPNTDMTAAFEPGTGAVTPPPAPPAQPTQPAAAATATVTPTPSATGPNVTVQVDDDTIDPGQSVSVTVIANDTVGIDWIEFEGVYDGNQNSNKNDNDSASDPAFARQQFDCDDSQKQCANVWTITPTVSGRYTLRGRARNVNNVRSEWVGISFQVRGNSTGATPTPTTGAATATATTQAAAPTTTPTQVAGSQVEPGATATPTPKPASDDVTPTPTKAP
jgi:hypothetical protein